ncbi:Predicted regulator PutR for proline utilization, GntR family [Caballeronia glathei]|jgi:DNA-binding GntR family transcriptional regulator|uniref:GntR family transcriptional regulator n=1 Tax=Caballeronia glathei TaxID=60547 RepID=A0A069PKY7_9BURK|nr:MULTISPECIES: GntR family transcriptional regulator [Burkholderiaceae]KDR41280.1 GntR family transcriptional regulator [Caballeronia glathei]TCK39362.1 GntR family transcriptional regulator [Paraburkholderia sp. BL8N3]CDY78502.1 Predicted regulator PutR for proline utilization, GntR family [Caballeronia glathei]
MTFFTKLDQVAERLRERIIAGEYKHGDKLKQAEIAAELGVSITPVREALKVLEMEGFIVSVPHKGLSVPHIAAERAQEIFELRVLLERRLTQMAVERMTKEQIAELRGMHKEFSALVKKREIYAVRAANVRFHFRVYEMADCPQTLQFVRVLWAKYPFNFHDDQVIRFKQLLQEHAEFMRKLEAGDKEGAVAAMVDHIQTGWSRVSKNI